MNEPVADGEVKIKNQVEDSEDLSEENDGLDENLKGGIFSRWPYTASKGGRAQSASFFKGKRKDRYNA